MGIMCECLRICMQVWCVTHACVGGHGTALSQAHLEGDLPLLVEVRLVAHKHHHGFSGGDLPLQVPQPLLSLAEGILKRGKIEVVFISCLGKEKQVRTATLRIVAQAPTTT